MEKDPLEFNIIKEYIKEYAVSDYGRSKVDLLSPLDSWDKAAYMWELTTEMQYLHDKGISPQFSNLPKINELIDFSMKEGVVLEGQDIVTISWALKEVSKLKHELKGSGEALKSVIKTITPLDWLTKEIDNNLKETGEVSDKTNPILRDLRRKYRSVRTAIIDSLENILKRLEQKHVVMEKIVTSRNDRFVIPLRHDYGRVVKGIVHDYSRKRHTVYVEPLDTVELNNRLNQLKALIQEEETKVLRRLTSFIRDTSEIILANLNTYGMLDLINACTIWSQDFKAIAPEIKDRGIFLKNARHPILFKRLGEKACVPVDIVMPEDKDCLVISGPNADGKTVSLKTLGLLTTMAKAGLYITAQEGSYISRIGKVWVEIDSAQDIRNDLSSFSAHASALREIYMQSRSGDLVLLDEPGGGTDPEQGGAIAIALIDALRKKGAYTVVTSHSRMVKLYGLTKEGVHSACVAYDERKLMPLYRLEYDKIGQSKALDILKTIGFPAELIAQARAIISRDTSSPLAKAIEDLGKIRELELKALSKMERAEHALKSAKEQKEKLDRIRIETAIRYKRLISKLEDLLKRPPSRESIKKIKEMPEAEQMEEVIAKIEGLAAEKLDIKPGRIVRVKGSSTAGRVECVTGRAVEIISGTKKIKVDMDLVEVLESEDYGNVAKGAISHVSSRGKPFVAPVVVVGLRVDEALPVVEKALDDAILSGQDTLEIIHGSGTGRLKSAIRAYLKEVSFVRSITDGPLMEGGGNKTIVELKQDE
ncbi:MAG: hypothetical protein DRG37_04400 [Deltaproteobacteria bacterium]|nr:MAG: hypothetical protein DRG37_04400 [Deltaproteobacteria bacterium]